MLKLLLQQILNQALLMDGAEQLYNIANLCHFIAKVCDLDVKIGSQDFF